MTLYEVDKFPLSLLPYVSKLFPAIKTLLSVSFMDTSPDMYQETEEIDEKSIFSNSNLRKPGTSNQAKLFSYQEIAQSMLERWFVYFTVF
jgi:hypothetical protein